MTIDTALQIRPLSGTLGAELLGELDDDAFQAVAQALWNNQVLIVPDQHLDPETHLAFGKRFGSLHTHPAASGVDGHPEILLLANRGKKRNITQVWHSDVSCEQRPPSTTEVTAAVEALAEELRGGPDRSLVFGIRSP